VLPGSPSTSPEDIMQELGAGIDSLSLKEALASVEAVKKEIARLEKEREIAMDSYTATKKQVEDATRLSIFQILDIN
jgi:hypothetical protein